MRAAKGIAFEILGVGPSDRFSFGPKPGGAGRGVLHVTLCAARGPCSVIRFRATNVERHETVRLPVHGRVREKRR
jgi:hypothetical protein